VDFSLSKIELAIAKAGKATGEFEAAEAKHLVEHRWGVCWRFGCVAA
jgi:hypothetical protein